MGASLKLSTEAVLGRPGLRLWQRPQYCLLLLQSPFLLSTGPAVSHLAIPATAPLDLWPQILQLASVTKNLVPMSGRVLVLQSDVHLLRCLIPWLSESLESCVLLGFVSLVPTIVDTMVVPNKHLWNASLSKHMND